MNRNLKNISLVTLVLLLPLFQGCTELGSFLSSKPSSGNSGSSWSAPVKEVRGPTGGGTGGGIIIVDDSGKTLKSKKYDLYVRVDGLKQKLKSGYTDSNGEVSLDSDTFSQVRSGDAELIVEVYDGTEKSLANAELIDNSDS